MAHNRGLRRIYWFIVISLATLVLVLVGSSDRNTLDALRFIRLDDLLWLGLLTIGLIVLDALRITVLTKSLGKRVPLRYALKTVLVGRFFAAITPVQSGMVPAEMFMLNKWGLPLGQAIGVDVIKRITTMGMLAAGGVAVLFLSKEFAGNTLLLYVYYYVIAFFILLMSLFLFVYFCPRQTLWLVDRALHHLHARGIIKSQRTDEYIHAVAADYFAAMDFYTHRGLPGLLLAVVVSGLFVGLQFALAPVIIHALGFRVNLLAAIQAQVILLPMLYYSPTPGGSGVAEGGFALLFAGLIPKHLVGISVVLWRIFGTYLYVAIGAVFTVGSMDIEKVLSFLTRQKDED